MVCFRLSRTYWLWLGVEIEAIMPLFAIIVLPKLETEGGGAEK